jgi:hypothetical protein
MAFIKPTVKQISTDIKELSIYLRSTKKFGKTTLFRDTILAKYGDPSRGLLVGCGNEMGYKLLNNLNSTQVSSWKDLMELKQWLINEKGKEHNIEIVCFDTADELVLLADQETIRVSNAENPTKRVKTIKAAMGGYTAGEKYSANNVIKPFMTDLQKHGFGVWCIAHTKMKSIKEKGSLDEEGYMQLSSNLSADYESAFGDIFDITLTGVIDRDFEEKKVDDKVKKYTTDIVRKLYFRETPMIDAGGRFAYGSVPDYLVFDKPDMGKIFLDTIEEGMRKSGETKNVTVKNSVDTVSTKTPEPEKTPEPVDEDDDTFEDMTPDEDTFDIEAYREEIRTKFKASKDKEVRDKVREILTEKCGKKLDNADKDVLDEINALL